MESKQWQLSAQTLAGAQTYLRSLGPGALGQRPQASHQEWEQFYTSCDPVIRRFAASRGVRGAELDDCTQEVWLELIRRLPDFEFDPQRGQFHSWLYALVRSAVVDRIRRSRRQRTVPLELSAAQAAVGREEDPSEQWARHEHQGWVFRRLEQVQSRLSAQARQLLALRFIKQRPVQEVALVLQITPAQVWFRQHRLKKKLQRLLCLEELPDHAAQASAGSVAPQRASVPAVAVPAPAPAKAVKGPPHAAARRKAHPPVAAATPAAAVGASFLHTG